MTEVQVLPKNLLDNLAPFAEAEERSLRGQVADAAADAMQRIRRREMADLAMALLDLRVVCEFELRTITAIQRNVERVRAGHKVTAEAELLLGETSRQLHDLEEANAGGQERLHATGCHLIEVLRAYGQPAENE
jgi:hypothetical protein